MEKQLTIYNVNGHLVAAIGQSLGCLICSLTNGLDVDSCVELNADVKAKLEGKTLSLAELQQILSLMPKEPIRQRSNAARQ